MNINLTNSSLVQNIQNSNVAMPTSNANFIQSNQKTILQLPDNRLVQIAQNPGGTGQPLSGAFILHMPYRQPDINIQNNNNQNLLNKKLLLKTVDNNSPLNFNKIITSVASNCLFTTNNFIPNSNNVILNTNAGLINNSSSSGANNISFNCQVSSASDGQPQMATAIGVNPMGLVNQNPLTLINPSNQLNTGAMLNGNNSSLGGNTNNILPLDKYQEISDMLHAKKLLSKLNSTEDHVLVEFRLLSHKFQLRMTKTQKTDMEKLLVAVSNQQRQMEILQVYQAEQRKAMLQRTSLMVNSHNLLAPTASNVNKPLLCPAVGQPGSLQMNPILKPQIQPQPQQQSQQQPTGIMPMNSVYVAVSGSHPQQQYNDPSSSLNFHPITSAVVSQPGGLTYSPNPSGTGSRLSTPQSSILASPAMRKELARDNILRLHSGQQQQQQQQIQPAISASQQQTRKQSLLARPPIALAPSPGSGTSNSIIINHSQQQQHTAGNNSQTTAGHNNSGSNNSRDPLHQLLPFPNANANGDMRPARSRRYNNMRQVVYEDHKAVLNPDYRTPFDLNGDLEDVARRLLPYHVLEEHKDTSTASHREVDRVLFDSFNQLNKKFDNLKRISSAISIKESLLHEHHERLLVKRMQLDLEKDVLEREKISQQSFCASTRQLVPLLFDDHGNAYPSLQHHQEVLPPPAEVCEDYSMLDLLSPVSSAASDIAGPSNLSPAYPDVLQQQTCPLEPGVPVSQQDVEEDTTAHDHADSVSDQTLPAQLDDDIPPDIVAESAYNIRDFSFDSADSKYYGDCDSGWNNDSMDSTSEHSNQMTTTVATAATMTTMMIINNTDDNNQQQSEDPTVDAAIKSILF